MRFDKFDGNLKIKNQIHVVRIIKFINLLQVYILIAFICYMVWWLRSMQA